MVVRGRAWPVRCLTDPCLPSDASARPPAPGASAAPRGGVLGGATTFSGYTFAALAPREAGAGAPAAGDVLGSPGAGPAAGAVGMAVARLVPGGWCGGPPGGGAGRVAALPRRGRLDPPAQRPTVLRRPGCGRPNPLTGADGIPTGGAETETPRRSRAGDWTPAPTSRAPVRPVIPAAARRRSPAAPAVSPGRRRPSGWCR